MKKIEGAYCAGIIDGEGCISLTIHRQLTKYGWKDQVCHKVYVANTNKRLLEWLVEITGLGKVKKYSQSKSTKWERFDSAKIKPLFVWAIWGNGIRQFLPQILPYLVIKQEHAELMLESLKVTGGQGYGSHLTEEQKQRRREIADRMKELNKRGL